MSDTLKTKEELGNVLVQVQDDLRQLKRSLGRIPGTEVLDIQALDTAICRTETGIRKRAEEYLNTANKQLLILPSIEDHKKTVQIPKWKPPLENIPACPQREDPAGPSPGQKHKSALTMRLLCNPAHPKNRDVMHQTYGIPLPEVHKKRVTSPPHDRIIKGPSVRSRPTVPGGHGNTFYLALRPSEKDKGTGIVSLLEKGFPSSEPDVCLRETPVQYKAVSLHPREDLCSPVQYKAVSLRPREDLCSSKMGLTSRKSRCQKQLTWVKEPGPTQEGTDRGQRTPPPTAASKGSCHRTVMPGTSCLTSVNPQDLPVVAHVATSKFPFTITEGRTDPAAADFCCFKQQYCQYWGTLVYTLGALEKLLRDFAVPIARVSGERLVDVGQRVEMGWIGRVPTVEVLLSVLENRGEVWGLLSRPGQRYRGEGGTEAAAIRIQSCWRRHLTRTAYLGYLWRKRVVLKIATSWLMRTQMRRVRKALQARRFRQLENYRSRAQHLAANWKHIQSSRRTIIHIPSLGYSQSQRIRLKDLDVLQNIQISRLCDIRDENVEVIYVSPRRLDDDMSHYYASLLRPQATEGPAQSSCTKRFTILTPDALEFFPTHSMCLSTLLKYSPRTLRRIRNLIQGKQAYMVGGVAHVDDLAVADELGVPILGPEPAVARHYSTKSGGRRLFTGAEVDVPPGQGNMYSLNQLHETLARLMTQNMHVQRWLFKMDSEFDGRGTAYCDVSHLGCYSWALQQYRRWGPDHWNTEWAQETVLLKYLDEVPEWLARHAHPAKTSCYPNWACFLNTFLRQGGVVEAYPPSDSVTCLSVDLLLEPGKGEVIMLSCGDQLHGSCQLETVGSSVPQTSVSPDVLRSVCTRVGRACRRCLIIGYISLDLATFLDPSTLEQRVWAIDLDLTYSNQLAMTQMLLMMTGGTLDCHTCRLEVPVPIKEKSSAQQIAAKPPMASRYAVIGSRLFNTNLCMLRCKSFFLMCKDQGIRFDIKEKQGTVFALHDSSKRYSLGMIAVSEDLQGALQTFALNLSVIHQEISSPKMQAETNFKDLIKEIEDVLRMTVQNEVQSEEDDKAVAQT